MSALLLHDGLEGIDEGQREKSRALCQREKSEGEKAVDAFAEPGNHKGPFRVWWPAVFRLRRQRNAIGLHEIGENLFVTPFLKPVELDGAPQQSVLDRLGITEHAQPGLPFGLHSDIPNRQSDEA